MEDEVNSKIEKAKTKLFDEAMLKVELEKENLLRQLREKIVSHF